MPLSGGSSGFEAEVMIVVDSAQTAGVLPLDFQRHRWMSWLSPAIKAFMGPGLSGLIIKKRWRPKWSP